MTRPPPERFGVRRCGGSRHYGVRDFIRHEWIVSAVHPRETAVALLFAVRKGYAAGLVSCAESRTMSE
jgi:hypothetical protein